MLHSGQSLTEKSRNSWKIKDKMYRDSIRILRFCYWAGNTFTLQNTTQMVIMKLKVQSVKRLKFVVFSKLSRRYNYPNVQNIEIPEQSRKVLKYNLYKSA